MPSTAEPDHSRRPPGRVAFVTGGGGFLGGATARALAAAGWRVAALGHGVGAQAIPATITIEGDVDRARLDGARAATGPPQLVVHCAGGASVPASVADPAADRARSLEPLQAVLRFLEARAGDARLVFPSSAAVYGGGEGPIREDAPLAPVSPYGRHKLEAEAMIAAAAAGFGLDAVVVRFFSAYGPGLRKQLFWDLARRLAARPAEVQLAGDGDELRDFVFVDDAVDLVGVAAALERRAEPWIVNGGRGRGVSVREAADGLAQALGAHTRIRFSGKGRAGDPHDLVADITLARTLGFDPKVGLGEGLERYVRWLAVAAAGA